ncbi:hypothetical protein, conserved [Eimeria maxima]|uniref:Uncharacterized protein n=1 Tax=Eimeria maxima TaxID=5804 RepID=U6MDN8_EIMMA|nr:hypothetical protein, conserved [Eimeria maxima]CDJ59795.1 hypothetical protein, conserved [Eimeria maxima]
MEDPLARATLFGIVNAPLGVTAPPDVVDAFLLLRHKISGVEGCQGQQLELLYERFCACRDGKKDIASQEAEEQATREAESHGEGKSENTFAADSLSDAVASAKADMRAFSVEALQKQIYQLSSKEQEKSQECSGALGKLLMECCDSHHSFEKSESWLNRAPCTLLQEEQDAVSAAEEALFAALSHSFDIFPSVLSEALEMTGVVGTDANTTTVAAVIATAAEEKGRQGQRSSRRQANKGRHDSKAADDPNGSSPTAAAAVAAAAAAITASGIASEEEGVRTRQRVAEQLLQWLVSEAVAAAEPQLMLQAAEKTTAWGGIHAEAARHRWRRQPACEALELQLQRTPLPSRLDHRVLRMAEYLSKRQAPTVKSCTRAVVIFDGKTTDGLLSLLQGQPGAEKHMWMQQLLQSRLGYLGDLLPQASEGVLLCLEIPRHQQQKLQAQHPMLAQQLMQKLVEEYMLPAVLGDDPQQYQVPVACLETAEDIAIFVEGVAAKKGIGLANDHMVSGERASQDEDTAEDSEDVPCLLVLPSWQQFFLAATDKLEDIQRESMLETSQTALTGTQKEDGEDAGAPTSAENDNYLSVRRHLSKLCEVLDIDFVALDSPCYLRRTAEDSISAISEVVLKEPQMVAAAAAAATASSPWLLQGQATRAVGPYVVAYLQAACFLLGIDPIALSQRAAEAVVDWREERHRRQSLDAAAASAKRQMQRSLDSLSTNSRSCCCSTSSISPNRGYSALTAESVDCEGPVGAPILDATEQQTTHTVAAVLCAYWDRIVPTGQVITAVEEATAEEPLFKWASLQLQKLRMLVSGTIVSSVLLAGDLISLICGLALNGEMALEIDVQETPRREDTLLDPQQEADAAAAAAAAAAGAAGAGDAASTEPCILRGWLRLCRTPAVQSTKTNTSGVTGKCCSIHPRVYNLRQLRKFVQTQLRVILEIAREREVVVQLPTEVLIQADPQVAALAAGVTGTPAEAAPRGRRTSDAVGGTQRNGSKKPRGSTKVEPAEGHIEDSAGDAAGPPAAEEEKRPPVLAVCHLPPAELLWKVVFAVSNDLPASSEEEMISNTTTRRRSAEGIEPSRVCGAYATMTQQAIENAVASFEGPTHVLWVGGKLSRETEGTDNLLNAAGIPDATVAMVESLVKAKNMLETSFSNPDDDFGYRAPSADSVLLESSASLDASSSQISTMSNSEGRRASLRNGQEKLGTEHLLLFGSIAKNTWAFANKGIATVEAFLDVEPLLQMLQGRRVKDILLADDMFLGQGKANGCTPAKTKVQTVYNFHLNPPGSN